MKNPLRRRLLRELRDDIGKYLVIFLLLTGTIGFVSGFLVADGSMIIAYNESFDKYNVEDGNFRMGDKMNKAQKKIVEAEGVTLYDNFYIEEETDYGSTMRIFKMRDEVNGVCLMEGHFPESSGEIAVDRMHADNNGLKVGDVIVSDTHTYTVTGLIALSDYSALFSDNNDTMFDAIKFGAGIVSGNTFSDYDEELLKYDYAWKYENEPADDSEEKDFAEELMKVIVAQGGLESFIPRYRNQAINFTGEDMGGDRAMMITLLYIVMVIMAFVFGIIINNTIVSEANVIGTLRASGYTKRELIRHYMAMPMMVTLISAFVGNILGYSVFKDVCAGMYYGSYSLPTYVTVWNSEAFLLTTVVPVALMAVITYFTLRKRLKLSPLNFLRRDLSKKKRRISIPLPGLLPFFTRFRIRIILQNMSNYVILFMGIIFANLLLMFGLLLPAILDNYQEEIRNNLLCNYQYILSVPLDAMDEEHKLKSLFNMMIFQDEVDTENSDAEKFSAYTLKTMTEGVKTDDVMIYGLEPDSRYINISPGVGEVYISSAFADKYGYQTGDVFSLKEQYGNETYDFTVGGIYDYIGGISIFMYRKEMNLMFDLDEDYFCGYLSDTRITDIDDKYIGSVIDIDALTKISRQLDVSMGSMMTLVDGFAMLMFMVIIYLLSKIIIEKNAQSISMAKILGYSSWEISRLYIISTSIVVICFLLLSLPIETRIMEIIFRAMVTSSMSGWIPFYINSDIYVKMFLMGLVTYLIVAAFEFGKIKRIPMEEALKCTE